MYYFYTGVGSVARQGVVLIIEEATVAVRCATIKALYSLVEDPEKITDLLYVTKFIHIEFCQEHLSTDVNAYQDA